MMEDNELKNIFDSFDPVMPSDTNFMAKLSVKLDTVEMLRKEQESYRRRHRRSVAIAMFAGFCTGTILTILMPYATEYLSGLSLQLPHISFITAILPNYHLFAYIIIAISTIIISLYTYTLSINK